MSATAKKDEMELIAVVMNGETSKSRFQDAVTMLNYGYANYRLYRDTEKQRKPLYEIPVKAGVQTKVLPVYQEEFSCLLQNGENSSAVEKRLEIPEELTAPIEKNQEIGKLLYYYGERKLGEVAIVAKETVEAAKYPDYVKRVWLAWMM